MNLANLNPWNWFKYEDSSPAEGNVPVTRSANEDAMPTTVHPASGFGRDFDRLFEDMLTGLAGRQRWPAIASTSFRPTMNVSGDGSGYELTLEAPGMDRDDLSIDVDGDRLIIRGEKREASEDSDPQFYRVERRYGSFQRVLVLPDDADRDSLKASLKAGVLTINLAIAREGRRDLPADHDRLTDTGASGDGNQRQDDGQAGCDLRPLGVIADAPGFPGVGAHQNPAARVGIDVEAMKVRGRR